MVADYVVNRWVDHNPYFEERLAFDLNVEFPEHFNAAAGTELTPATLPHLGYLQWSSSVFTRKRFNVDSMAYIPASGTIEARVDFYPSLTAPVLHSRIAWMGMRDLKCEFIDEALETTRCGFPEPVELWAIAKADGYQAMGEGLSIHQARLLLDALAQPQSPTRRDIWNTLPARLLETYAPSMLARAVDVLQLPAFNFKMLKAPTKQELRRAREAAAAAELAAGICRANCTASMCRVDDDLIAAHVPSNAAVGTTCQSLSDLLLTKVVGKTSWADVTCDEVAKVTWVDAGSTLSLKHHLATWGSECCGTVPQTRCIFMDTSNICTTEAAFLPANSSGVVGAAAMATCEQASAWLLEQTPGRTAWTNVTCNDIAGTSTIYGGASALLLQTANACCGAPTASRGSCNTTSVPNMCRVDDDLIGAHYPSTTAVGTTCQSLSDLLLAKVSGKTSWSDVTCDEVATVEWFDEFGSTLSLKQHLATWGAECCGTVPQTRCADTSNICTVEDAFLPATAVSGVAEYTCEEASAWLLSQVPGKTAWTNVTCRDIKTTATTEGMVGAVLQAAAAACCGGGGASRGTCTTTAALYNPDVNGVAELGDDSIFYDYDVPPTERRTHPTGLTWIDLRALLNASFTETSAPTGGTKQLGSLLAGVLQVRALWRCRANAGTWQHAHSLNHHCAMRSLNHLSCLCLGSCLRLSFSRQAFALKGYFHRRKLWCNDPAVDTGCDYKAGGPFVTMSVRQVRQDT